MSLNKRRDPELIPTAFIAKSVFSTRRLRLKDDSYVSCQRRRNCIIIIIIIIIITFLNRFPNIFSNFFNRFYEYLSM